MTRLLTREEQEKLDRLFVERTGLPSALLMEQAAAGLAGTLARLLGSFPEREGDEFDLLFFAGPGKNGGDAWAAARQLMASGYEVVVYDALPDLEPGGDAGLNKRAYLEFGGERIETADQLLGQLPLIAVDALYGTGYDSSRPLLGGMKRAFAFLAALKEKAVCVVACDMPSGIDANTGQAIEETVAADFTATFGRRKIGLVTHPGCLYAGELIEFPLSMTDRFVEDSLAGQAAVHSLEAGTLPDRLEERAPDGHKGQFGRILLIGGAEGMTGALILAARAGEKMGAGYTMLRAPERSLPLIAAAVPSALLSAVPEEGPATKRDLPQHDAVAVGIGAGHDPWVEKALRHLVHQPAPLIIDADGLKALAGMADAFDLLRGRYEKGWPPAVLTPHVGEYRLLLPEEGEDLLKDRLTAARALADRARSIVVLKGMATVIALPDGRAFINTTGNVGLAKGGSGDVLTGMIAGLAAQMDSVEEAVLRAVYLHGLAADLAADSYGSETVVTPEDLIQTLGQALSY